MTEAAKKKKIFDGRYEVLSIVGRGAASVVYHARHVGALTSEVALKVLLKQAGKDSKVKNSDLLRKEALAMVSARHKHVVRLDDFHSVDELCYLAMEYAPLGDTRKFTVAQGGKLNPQLGELFFSQCAEALDFVHRVGIIHRDLKPDNILVVSEKEIRLADFGVAVLPGETHSIKELQAGIGTMSYMAPEVLEGVTYDKRSDIYSLGVTFYELLSGIQPFEKAPLIEQLNVRQDNNIPPLHVVAPEVPPYLSQVIMQAISYDPAKRFANCQDLIQSLLVKKSQSAKTPEKPQNPAPAQPEMKINETSAPTQRQPQPTKVEAPHKAPQPPRKAEPAPAVVKPPVQEAKKPAHPAPVDLFAPPGPEEPVAKKPDIIIEPAQPEEKVEKLVRPANEISPQAASMHKAIENRKPKRSLEDLRNLARETKSDTPTAKSIRQENNKTSSRADDSANAQKSPPLKYVIILFLAAIIYSLFNYIRGGSEAPENMIVSEEVVVEPGVDNKPPALAFPHLPKGVYHGSVRGAFKAGNLPLSFVSLGAERGVIVILGIEGFTPQVVIPDADATSLRISANGLILDFKGNTNESSAEGELTNIVTGEKGTWRVENTQ